MEWPRSGPWPAGDAEDGGVADQGHLRAVFGKDDFEITRQTALVGSFGIAELTAPSFLDQSVNMGITERVGHLVALVPAYDGAFPNDTPPHVYILDGTGNGTETAWTRR